MASHAARGKKALENSDYPAAIDAYTSAIKEHPTSPDYFIQRSTAHQRAQDPAAALHDAEQAVLYAQQRAKRDLIIEAQFRRGVALWHLGQYADADFVLGRVKAMKSDHKMAPIWIKKAELSLQALEADDERRKVTVSETPTLSSPAPAVQKDQVSTSTADSATTKSTTSKAATTTASAPPALPQQTPASKIRYEWYQSTSHIYFSLLAKGVPKDDPRTQIEVLERSLSISFPILSSAGGVDSTYELTLDPLFAAVTPDKCITRVMGTKIEIILAKATPGQKWAVLEAEDAAPAPAPAPAITSSAADDTTDSAPSSTGTKSAIALSASTATTAPSYPTSSRTGPKNWDKITAEATSADKKHPEADSDDEGGDPANGFFKKLFKGASPDMQRAMMKSYTESNGTSLSTNWDEVRKGKVETVPPEGMEAKKW